MNCILCESENIEENYEVLKAITIINCKNCMGKYFIYSKGNELIIKYPKGNINFAVCLASMLSIIPIGLLVTLIKAKSNFGIRILQFLIILYANFIIITIFICFLQCIYNYFFHGYMIFWFRIYTKDSKLLNKIYVMFRCIIVVIMTLIISIYMNYSFFEYLFK